MCYVQFTYCKLASACASLCVTVKVQVGLGVTFVSTGGTKAEGQKKKRSTPPKQKRYHGSCYGFLVYKLVLLCSGFKQLPFNPTSVATTTVSLLDTLTVKSSRQPSFPQNASRPARWKRQETVHIKLVNTAVTVIPLRHRLLAPTARIRRLPPNPFQYSRAHASLARRSPCLPCSSRCCR